VCCGFRRAAARIRPGLMTEPCLMRPEIIDATRRRAAIQSMRIAQVSLPTWSELADPLRMPAAVETSLKSVGADEPDARNLWRVHWFNGSDRIYRVAVPGHVVLPEAVTGVQVPIGALLGPGFPLVAAQSLLAACACLI